MNELDKIKNDEIFTDSMIIADGTNNEHESIVRLIDNYTPELEELGKIEFTDLKSGKRGRPS
ncbi:Rha family transcriptional regulator, partial [Vallitalea sediminicola]